MSPAGGAQVDVLIVSLGATQGLRAADEQLRGSLERAGASVAIATAAPPRQLRTLMLTDLAWARSARVAAERALARLEIAPRAILYSSTTAALLWPRAGAIRFDATAAGNRLGRHGLWQRPLERRRLGEAPLLLPWSEGALREGPRSLAGKDSRALVVPVAVEPVAVESSDRAGRTRDIAAITYAANPAKKGLDRVLAAWHEVSGERGSERGEVLVIAGVSERELVEGGYVSPGGAGVRIVGRLAREEYRALVRRARVFVCAPRREDYGIAQLEALADGCLLVTTPAPGPYAALPIARALEPRLVVEDLAAALRVALGEPLRDYAERARAAIEPFSALAVGEVVAEQLLPRLLGRTPQL